MATKKIFKPMMPGTKLPGTRSSLPKLPAAGVLNGVGAPRAAFNPKAFNPLTGNPMTGAPMPVAPNLQSWASPNKLKTIKAGAKTKAKALLNVKALLK